MLIWGIWPLLIGSLLTILMGCTSGNSIGPAVMFRARRTLKYWLDDKVGLRWSRGAGDPGQNRRIEAIRIELGNEIPAGIGCISGTCPGIGWQGGRATEKSLAQSIRANVWRLSESN